ncbi:hypothetical protein BDV98DRAFT_574341 [Pterulicium gracile]|uniref:Uncharacterized protein n=1 Tax=Pterulicium gracile TaxID=1884261 RepID=A0A5C3Q966_9AGAR|nr:hypothetical protein BDV98DRAFT_574341 [Pterula gracilis]
MILLIALGVAILPFLIRGPAEDAAYAKKAERGTWVNRSQDLHRNTPRDLLASFPRNSSEGVSSLVGHQRIFSNNQFSAFRRYPSSLVLPAAEFRPSSDG